MNIEEIKKVVCDAIDEHKNDIIDFAKKLESCPELGYKEFETSENTKKIFDTLQIPYEDHLGITGIKAKLKDSWEGPNIAILGELDAVFCPESKMANPLTHAAHACGHNLQMAAMIGSAFGLKKSGVSEQLYGNVTFLAVPAEEFIDLAYREKLRQENKIRFFGGKQELIYNGAFDDVDMAMMMHSEKNSPEAKISIGNTSNGFVAKSIQYLGKTAHAAEAPHDGINALNAAMIGLTSIHALRETFIDTDHVRVHPIITKGGDSVNSVPADVRMETYVRAKSMKAIENANTKVDNALKAGGLATGAQTIIKTVGAYLPLNCSEKLNKLFAKNAEKLLSKDQIHDAGHFGASTDMGDLSHLIPTIHPFVGGVDGALHTEGFHTVDYDAACIIPAKLFAMTIIDLLGNKGYFSKEIINNFKPLLTKEEYIQMMENYLK
ncbi:amidohydrolase [Inediibacterium massiliense]|uniref:amidohydrolase n=1 Tax=Inediibacterium massiliense TaxID=1658111 RepID=UPI0006B64E97|nr:amidohydrolase [Inediibacterium massiliense]